MPRKGARAGGSHFGALGFPIRCIAIAIKFGPAVWFQALGRGWSVLFRRSAFEYANRERSPPALEVHKPAREKRSRAWTYVKVAENVVTNYWLRIAASTQHFLDRGCMHLLVTDFLTGKFLKRDAMPFTQFEQLSI